MSHKPPIQPGESIDRYLARVQSEHAAGGGGTLSRFFDSQGNQLFVEDIQNQQFVQDESGIFYIPRFDALGNFEGVRLATSAESGALNDALNPTAPPGSAGRTQFPSEVERDQAAAALARAQAGALETPVERAAQLQFDRDRAAADRQADIDAAALREEGANRRERLGTLTRLIEGFLGQQSQARDTLANLQPDQFRFAAVKGGIAPFGTTPQGAFQQELQQLAGAQVPQFDPSGSAASLEPVIAQLTGAQAPQAPQTFGLADGGTVTPSAQPQSFLVGEKGPEVMTVTAQGVQVTPLAGGMQDGGAIGFPFQPIKFKPESLLPALTTSGIFQSGQNIPRGQVMPDQSIAGFGGGVGFRRFGGVLEQSGSTPQFISPFGRDEIFYRDPNTPGQFRLVTGGDAVSQIQPRSVVQVSDADFNAGLFGRLGNTAIGAGELTNQLAMVRDTSQFTKFSAPLIEPTTGTILPAPFMVASELNQLRVTDPGAFNLLLNAYELAGQPATSVLSTIQAALPFGQARGAVGLR